MRRMLVLALVLASAAARAQDIDLQYYYSPEPTICSGGSGHSCSIVECKPGWKNCACPLVLPNGWKRPLSKEQCDAASRTLPLYRFEEVPRHPGSELRKTEASASSTSADDKPLSINQMNTQIQKGQGPKGITRVDRGKVPGEQDHAHFGEDHALNRDGTWKHGGMELTRDQRDWLRKNGWNITDPKPGAGK